MNFFAEIATGRQHLGYSTCNVRRFTFLVHKNNRVVVLQKELVEASYTVRRNASHICAVGVRFVLARDHQPHLLTASEMCRLLRWCHIVHFIKMPTFEEDDGLFTVFLLAFHYELQILVDEIGHWSVVIGVFTGFKSNRGKSVCGLVQGIGEMILCLLGGGWDGVVMIIFYYYLILFLFWWWLGLLLY